MPVPDDSQYIVKSRLTPFEYPKVAVGQYLANRISQHDPEVVALLDPSTGYKITFGELHRTCQNFAWTLAHRFPTNKQDLVLFYADNSIEYAVALLGTMYLGLTFVPVPPAHGPFELADQIRQCAGSVLIFGPNKVSVIEKMLKSADYSQSIRGLKLMVELDVTIPDEVLLDHELTRGKVYAHSEILELGKGRLLRQIPHFPIFDLEERFLICFTSGTTGPPKGAIHTHRSFVALLRNIRHPPSFKGLQLAFSLPLGHISGSIFIPQALDCGMTVTLFLSNDTEDMLKGIHQYRLEHWWCPMAAAAALAKEDYSHKYDLSCLKLIRIGGSKYPMNVIDAIRVRFPGIMIHEIYGATEFVGSIYNLVTKPELLDRAYQHGNLGPVNANVDMKIVDIATGRALPARQSGEVCFRGPQCFAGYLNSPDITALTIVDGWYHSGDVGYYDEAGNLFVTDRIKELIKFRFYSLFPAEIEDFLHRHPAVKSVCVTGVAHATDGYHIRAFVELIEGRHTTEQELADYVQENLGFQKRLRAGVKFIPEMPRTGLGKVDRQHFKRLVKDELITVQVE